ncbi:TonB-dependent receptor [Spirosoma terrae]|uniref:TonB-dependent receptor n=1 Tax=Spirosoma terrae TaxID=1968276 RepID=A0A6L9L4C2_9BACT|nr:TonB-dependent receptor [Spirosoma terrae]NDU95310.1 TonB-dependent receptor [Spirosoma terrae]
MRGYLTIWFVMNILAGVVQVGYGQSRSCRAILTGRILGADNHEPLTGATVYIRELATGAVADSAGNFQVLSVCPGRYTIDFQFVGYKTIDQTIIVRNDSTLSLAPIALLPDSETLREVVVTEHRSEAQQLLQNQAALSGNALEATRGQSLGESLKALPGLYSIQTGPSISKPVIHGLYSNRILTLNNGVRQEDQQWGSEHAPQIDQFLAAQLTVIKGAASIKYGSDAIGGVILVEPKAMPTVPGLRSEVNLVGGTNGRQGTVSGLMEQAFTNKLAGLSWRLQGTLKRVGYAKTPNYYLENSSYLENSFAGTVKYTKQRIGAELFYSQFYTKVGLFRGAQVGSLADFYAAIARPEPLSQPGFSYDLGRPYQQVQHDLLKAKAFIRSERLGMLTLTVAHQQNVRREYDIQSFSRVTDPELYLKLVTQTADLIWEHQPIKTANGGQLSGSVGFNGITQGNVRRFLFLIPNYRNYGGGVYALERYAHDRWTLEGGIRYDYRWLRAYFLDETTKLTTEKTRDWSNVTGSLGTTYQLTSKLMLSGNVSTAWRAPTVSDLYSNGLHQSAVAYEQGNPDLNPEQAYNLNVSVEYSSDRLYVDMGIYNNWINNYIYLKPDSVPIIRQRGAFPAYTYNQVRATFRGLDATVRYKLTSQLTLTSKTSLLFAYDHTNRDYLVYIPANHTENGLRYDFEKPASRQGRITDVYLSVNHQYVARQNRVPMVTQREENGQIIFTGDFAPPPPAYSLIGAEVGFSCKVGSNPMNVILMGTNLLNQSYRDYLDRFRYFADEPGRNIMLKVKLPLVFARG